MSLPEFLAWEPDDGGRYELVDGEPVAMASPSNVHALIHSELIALIHAHLRTNRASCHVLTGAGVIPRLFSARNMRIPDIAVTCAPVMLGQVGIPEPVVLIEILSPGNAPHTRSNVWAYASIPSVQEILVVDSTRIGAEILRRAADGAWPDEAKPVGESLSLESIGFQVRLADIYDGTGVID